MSFGAPLVLLGLLVLLPLAGWRLRTQRCAARAAAAFVSAPLRPSVAPRLPGLRRLIPPALVALALTLFILAAARPRIPVTVPVRAASVMLVNDVSDSMVATDVRPSRLDAAQRAAIAFTRHAVDTIGVGSVKFSRRPTLLQSPSTDHRLARQAIATLTPGGGGTAIGEAIETALGAIAAAPKIDGHRPPGAIVLLSDGSSNVGVSPLLAAAAARKAHVRIDTIAIGTASGTIEGVEHGRRTTIPVPVSPTQLRAIATASGGTFFAAPSQARAGAIYAHLARELGHRRDLRGLIGWGIAAGLLALLLGVGLSLFWFGTLA